MWPFRYTIFLTTFVYSQRLTEQENEDLQKICGKQLQSDHPVRRSMHTSQVARAAAPWVVRLENTRKWFPNMTMADRKKSTKPFCTGSLISPRHVLTAAHCVVKVDLVTTCNTKGDVLIISYGPINLGRTTARFTESCKLDSCKWGGSFKDINVPVKKAFVSKTYTGKCTERKTYTRGDVAIFELAEDIPYSTHVFPACLNTRNLNISETIEQFGYGISPSVSDEVEDMIELRHFKGPIVSCGEKGAPDIFCFQNSFSTVCSGDSGSGLFVYDEQNRASIIAPHSVAGKFNYATLVKPNLFWICAATGICLNDDAKEYKIYNEKGLAEFWYKTFEQLTGNDVYI